MHKMYLCKTTWVPVGIKHFPKNFKEGWFSDESFIDVYVFSNVIVYEY